MPLNQPLLSAWREAEALAAEAEQVLFTKALAATDPSGYPTRQEIQRARDLRLLAVQLVHQVLADVQATAEAVAFKIQPISGTPAAMPARRRAESVDERDGRSQEGAGPPGARAA